MWNYLNDYPLLWVIFSSVVIIHITLAVILAFQPQITSKFYFDYYQVKKGLEATDLKLEKQDYDIYALRTTRVMTSLSAQTIYELLQKLPENGQVERETAKLDIENILLPFLTFKEEVFGFRPWDKYSFAVYLYDQEEDLLKCFYREADIGRPLENRNWRPGRGHIGTCFTRKTALISRDVNELDFLVEDQEEERGDFDIYRSMASVPIVRGANYPIPEDVEILGVFIVTSDRPQQFSKAEHETLVFDIGFHLSQYFTKVCIQTIVRGE